MDDEMYFAGCALQALIALKTGETPDKIAKRAFEYADAMTKEMDARRQSANPFAQPASPAPAKSATPFEQSVPVKKGKDRPWTETEMMKDALLDEYKKNKPRF